jgi:hypothetical protein
MSADDMKRCSWCGDEFKQAKPPKAAQIFCCYICHLASARGGDGYHPKDVAAFRSLGDQVREELGI